MTRKTRSARWLGAAATALLITTGGIVPAAAAPPSPSPTPPAAKSKKATTRTTKAPGSRGAFALPNAVGSCGENRFTSCGIFNATIDQFAGIPGGPSTLIGSWHIEFLMRMTSAADSGTVTVNVTAEVTATGTPVPGAWHLYLSYLDSDAPGGQSFKQFDVALVPGLVANGSGTFTPAAYNTAPPRTRLVYRWDDTTPVPGDNGVGATTSGLEVRCDNVVRATVGCVNPNYLPTVNFPNAPTVTSHIRAAQAQGKPSTLTKNSPATDANRRAACGNAEAVLGPKPSPDSTCDEYPFASTSEGGAGASIAWVPAAENSSQGGTLAGMTAANRVIDGDRYDVIP